MTDMKYGFRPDGPTDSFWDMFFPLTDVLRHPRHGARGHRLRVRRSCAASSTARGWGSAASRWSRCVYVTRDSLPVIGLLWNPRLLPFVYLLRYLLMMVGIVEIVHVRACAAGSAWPRALSRADARGSPGWPTAADRSASPILVIELFIFREMPGGRLRDAATARACTRGASAGRPDLADAHVAPTRVSDGWTRYNFTGYEGRPRTASTRRSSTRWPTSATTRRYGCGRALWENNGDNGEYGTTMALMLLPHWTDGCIASMEGLFFEASGTTPYHFLTAAAMSQQQLEPGPPAALRRQQRGARRAVPADARRQVRDGVHRGGQGAGRRATRADQARQIVRAVEHLPGRRQRARRAAHRPAGRGQQARRRPARAQPRARHELVPAPRRVGGDAGRRRARRVAADRRRSRPDAQRRHVAGRPGVDIVQPASRSSPSRCRRSTCRTSQLGEQDLSFNVDQIGVPVLVKISYFPNWEVDGAEGPVPHRAEPDGRGADLDPRPPDVRALEPRLRRLRPHVRSASSCSSSCGSAATSATRNTARRSPLDAGTTTGDGPDGAVGTDRDSTRLDDEALPTRADAVAGPIGDRRDPARSRLDAVRQPTGDRRRLAPTSPGSGSPEPTASRLTTVTAGHRRAIAF